jgi:molybdenum cofactor cytidylyltransferase
MTSFAIIPAAGYSTRMGQPKLLVPIAGRPLILHTIDAWKQSRIDRIVVVTRPDDQPLAAIVRVSGVDLVIPPLAPPDMKASIGYGLDHITLHYSPTECDNWLVAPADMPALSSRIINRLMDDSASQPGQILIPTIGSRRGHPVLVPWQLTREVVRLGEHEGLSALIDRQGALLVACDDLEVHGADQPFDDVDTPDDLTRFGGN